MVSKLEFPFEAVGLSIEHIRSKVSQLNKEKRCAPLTAKALVSRVPILFEGACMPLLQAPMLDSAERCHWQFNHVAIKQNPPP